MGLRRLGCITAGFALLICAAAHAATRVSTFQVTATVPGACTFANATASPTTNATAQPDDVVRVACTQWIAPKVIVERIVQKGTADTTRVIATVVL